MKTSPRTKRPRATPAPEPKTIIGTIPKEHTAHTLLGTLAWLKDAPADERRFVVPRTWPAPEPMNLATFRRWLLGCIDQKISSKDPRSVPNTVRKLEWNYQRALQRDARAIVRYRTERVVQSGSGLETKEGRRAAPDVHARFREPIW